MSNTKANLAIARGNSHYYDALWRRVGSELAYTEVARARFIVNAIRGIDETDNLRILDFGCGRGWMSEFLSPLGSVTGIDYSSVGIEIANEKYRDHGKFYVADVNDPALGLPDDTVFDVVVCSEVIEHVPNHIELLLQISGLLRQSGWCVLTTPNGNVWPQFNIDPRYKADQQPIENWLTTRELKDVFRRAGFRVTLHRGLPQYEIRYGRTSFLQRRRIEMAFNTLKMGGLYYRLIRPTALYQVAVAQKT